jgi:uncharacterized SAM-binding protein YcdF (DUF218 family)
MLRAQSAQHGNAAMIGSPSSQLPGGGSPSRSRRSVARTGAALLPRLLYSQTFLLGALAGLALYWLFSQVALMLIGGGPPAPLQPATPPDPPQAGGYHAIIIPAGGQHEDGPPPHVLARLERAVAIYKMSAEPKPFVITTAWGTPHKPCPHDAAGFERHEAADNARYLLSRGIPQTRLLEESVSLETIGNAYFTRLLHTDVRGLRRLAVVNNRFHMDRTRHVFRHVFSLPPFEGQPDAAYELEFVEVDDRLAKDVLEARLKKEAAAVPRFAPGGEWQSATATLRELHEWIHQENSAYASSRLLEERAPLDPELLKSY